MKLIVVYTDFADEDSARWYAEFLRTNPEHDIAEIYLVVDESEHR